jgi:hypothetical protein
MQVNQQRGPPRQWKSVLLGKKNKQICDEMQQGKSAIHFFTNLVFFVFFWIFSVFFQWLALVFLVFFGFPSGF